MKFYKKITCADGATVSVQASSSHYCTPRIDGALRYSEIEAGYPSVAPPESWMKYAETPTDPLETVYGYMPVECVREFIAAHGGMVAGELPPFVEAA